MITRLGIIEQVRTVLAQAIKQLTHATCPTPRLDAELLLAHVLGQERTWLYTYPDAHLTPEQSKRFEEFISRRTQREPVAYLTGHKAFFGLDFQVTSAVLIPRPETELLIETALDWVARQSPISNLQSPFLIADIGTGSGCLAVTLAKHLPQATVLAADISAAALAIARQNAIRHQVAESIPFVQGNLLDPLTGPFDLIVSNPPYVSDSDYAGTEPEVQGYEPRLALTAATEGLALIEQLLSQAKSRLKPTGMLLVEMGSTQGGRVEQMARQRFPQGKIVVKPDLAGLDRLLIVEV